MMQSLPGDTFHPGDLLNNTYRIEAILGRGGTSEVYRARSEISGRVVAIKALRAEFSRNDDYLALMTREEDIREIRDDAIVRYFDTQRTETGQVYLVMDYVEGTGLEDLLRRGGLPAEDLLTIARRVAGGLMAAHSRRIVHRDLSPDNIILRANDPHQAVIIDFGIAKDTNPGAATIVGNDFAGKYAYAAPEQLGGETDERSDLYALGALLLAAFRGRQPEPGTNPLEVVRRKALPLDLSGVPEPLAGLIAQLSAPAREDRFQSAREVMTWFARNAAPPPDNSAERTVIVPRPQTLRRAEATRMPPPLTALPAAGSVVPPSPPGAVAEAGAAPPAKSRALPYALAAVLLLAGGSAAVWQSGLLAPAATEQSSTLSLPPARPGPEPASDTATAPPSPPASATALPTAPPTEPPPRQSPGPGQLPALAADPPPTAPAQEIQSASLASGSTAPPPGTSPQPPAQTADPPPVPAFLPASALASVLNRFADCGDLRLSAPPATGYGEGATIRVAGNLSSTGQRVGLSNALRALAPGRAVEITGEVLNPTLCRIDRALPNAPTGNIAIRYSFGDRPDPNPEGRYFVGENPVIDVVIPAAMTTGQLFVSALDVSGNVFHMLPNLLQPENSIAALRNGATGPLTLRVAWPLAEAQGGDKLAFVVDDTALGKSRILAIHSREPIFDGLRPMTESAESYAEALESRAGPVDALDSRLLTTLARP